MDRRRHQRFDLNGRVSYSWNDIGGTRRVSEGITRDVSECGVYVFTDCLPLAGTAIQIEVSFSFDDQSEIRMRTRGKVLRVESKGMNPKPGFAAASETVWLGKSMPPGQAEALDPHFEKLSCKGRSCD